MPANLPPLREELVLHQGPANWDGSPAWTLEDPLRGRFFRLGWLEMALLSRWSLGDRQRLIAEVNQRQPQQIDEQDVENFCGFLQQHALLRSSGEESVRQFARLTQQGKAVWWRWLLHNYLFFRIPLFHPHRGLQRMLPWVAGFYRRPFWLATLIAGLTGLLFAGQQWQTFLHTFLHFFTLQGALLAGATLVLTKCLHELGHAFTCTRFGARVSTLGVAFLVLMPVLYTDTSASWKLPQRRQRLAIGMAGMLVELALAAWATLAWSFLPDGMWRSAAFMLATTTWMMTLLINLSPLMRFDGYFLLSDTLGVPNLQPRAFALARWKLRETLFGLGDEAPESWPRHLQRLLLSYAFATWVYRLFLFTGIALLVYHKAFKLLGILLFAVEIGWFVLLPVLTELRVWLSRRKDYRMNIRSGCTLAVGSLLLLALLLPWQRSVYAPALLRAAQQQLIYMPVDGQLATLAVQPGETVTRGQLLYRLSDLDEAHQRDQVSRQLQTLNWQQSWQVFNARSAADHQRIRQEKQAASQRLAVLRQQQQTLEVRAAFSGKVADQDADVHPGDWLGQGSWIGTVVSQQGGTVEALVAERDWQRLRQGDSGMFWPEDGLRRGVPVKVLEVGRSAITDMQPLAELASLYGGPVATLNDSQKRQLPPEQALYRVVLQLPPDQPSGDQVVLGTVVMRGEAQSLLLRGWKQVQSVLIRELSF